MDGKTGRPIISLKFKAPPAEAEQQAGQPAAPARKLQATGREALVVPKVPSRKQGVREVVVAKPTPVPAPAPAAKPSQDAKPTPIPPAAFKAATKAATQAVNSVLADPAWQSASLQRSYQEAKLRALPVHRKQAKLISSIVLKRVALNLEEGETRTLAMRAAYAAAFASLLGNAPDMSD